MVLKLCRALERLISVDRYNRVIVFFVRNELAGLAASLSALRPRTDAAPEGLLERREAVQDLGRLASEVEGSTLLGITKWALGSRVRAHMRDLVRDLPTLMRAYIDIDGVLLETRDNGEERPIPGFREILDYLRGHFDCYWLTTHVRGDGRPAADKLRPYLTKSGLDPAILDGIKPIRWTTLKTEAIDYRFPFIWLEDDPLSAEVESLDYRKCPGSLVLIDRRRRSGRLTVRRVREAGERALEAYLSRIS